MENNLHMPIGGQGGVALLFTPGNENEILQKD